MAHTAKVTRLKALLANYSRGTVRVARVEGTEATLRATDGEEWSADLGAMLEVLASLRREAGFAESAEGCRELVQLLVARVPGANGSVATTPTPGDVNAAP